MGSKQCIEKPSIPNNEIKKDDINYSLIQDDIIVYWFLCFYCSDNGNSCQSCCYNLCECITCNSCDTCEFQSCCQSCDTFDCHSC